jgi:DNA-directed RNA polymerase beta subunit
MPVYRTYKVAWKGSPMRIDRVWFGKRRPKVEPPNLIDIQLNSYQRFLDEDLKYLIDSLNQDRSLRESGKVEVEFVDYSLGGPTYSPLECKARNLTFTVPLKLTVRLINKETGEIKEQELFCGELPQMTKAGTFIVNGVERVVVSQLVRSPGVYFEYEKVHTTARPKAMATVIPDRGSWLEFEMDEEKVAFVKIDKKSKKFPVTELLRVMGDYTDDEIKELFVEEITATVNVKEKDALLKVQGKTLAEMVFHPTTGRDLYPEGTTLTPIIIDEIKRLDIETIRYNDTDIADFIVHTLEADQTKTREEALIDMFKHIRPGERPTAENAENLIHTFLRDPRRNNLSDVGRFKINKKLGLNLDSNLVTLEDIRAILHHLYQLHLRNVPPDNKDHLANKRVRSVGELLSNKLRIGFLRMLKIVREKIITLPDEDLTVQNIINVRPVTVAIKEFFGLGQLSQFMDQTNPIAEITHKRRLSSLGPGGLNRERAGADVRDVHNSHYSRICPIETPEGGNVGLINSLASYAIIDRYGFIQAPYLKVKNGKVGNNVDYLLADDEETFKIAQANTELDKDERITGENITRFESSFSQIDGKEIEYIDITPNQVFSIAASLIPFLEHNDAKRALMGCNQQHQAVPLIQPEAPRVGTGMEYQVVVDNCSVVLAKESGVVSYVDAATIKIASLDAPPETFQLGIINRDILYRFLGEDIENIGKIGELIDGSVARKLVQNNNFKVRTIRRDDVETINLKEFVSIEKNINLVGLKLSEPALDSNSKTVISAEKKVTKAGLDKLFKANINEVSVHLEDTTEILPVSSLKIGAKKSSFLGKILLPDTKDSDIYNKIDSSFLTEDIIRQLLTCDVDTIRIVDIMSLEENDVFIFDRHLLSSSRILAEDIEEGEEVLAYQGSYLTMDLLRRLSSAGIDELKVSHESTYKLQKFFRSNQDICINQHSLVRKGDFVSAGDVIIDGQACDRGDLAIGQNVFVAYLPWRGFNFLDAIIINERLVYDDVYTSIHIKEYRHQVRDTKVGPEELTREIPNVSEELLRNLDEDGIIRVGTEVGPGDILVGKVTPKAESEFTPEMKLWRAMFDRKGQDVRDSSKRVDPGETGVVISTQLFKREKSDELPVGVNMQAKVYVAQKRKIQVGDKMSGRHGNKGVISKILPRYDMPYTKDGTPIDIILSPLGVHARMNLGQIYEANLGYAAKRLGVYFATPVFYGADEQAVVDTLEKAGLPSDGKMTLYDGYTGDAFHQRVTVGYGYILKLDHLVEDKIHARSTGPYALITQQPLGGKAQFGGQRLGEMEVWALQAYGASNTLKEMLTLKSDDTEGRIKAYESICRGKPIPESGTPESFRVIQRELKGLCIDLHYVEAKEMNAIDEPEMIIELPEIEGLGESEELEISMTETLNLEEELESIIDKNK